MGPGSMGHWLEDEGPWAQAHGPLASKRTVPGSGSPGPIGLLCGLAQDPLVEDALCRGAARPHFSRPFFTMIFIEGASAK